MKKFIIGIVIVGIFLVYSVGIRHEQPVISKPSSSSTGSGTPASGNTAAASGSTPPSTSSTAFKNGTFTGTSEGAYWGNVQVAVTISGGKMTNVKFLQYPNSHQTSVYINQQAMPYLQQEAIKAQSSNVQTVSGATYTSQAFQQSLQTALSQA